MKLLSRIRVWAMASRLATKYAVEYRLARDLVNELGEFGAELTLHVAQVCNLEVPEAKRMALQGLAGIMLVVAKTGEPLSEEEQEMAEVSRILMKGINAPGGRA